MELVNTQSKLSPSVAPARLQALSGRLRGHARPPRRTSGPGHRPRKLCWAVRARAACTPGPGMRPRPAGSRDEWLSAAGRRGVRPVGAASRILLVSFHPDLEGLPRQQASPGLCTSPPCRGPGGTVAGLCLGRNSRNLRRNNKRREDSGEACPPQAPSPPAPGAAAAGLGPPTRGAWPAAELWEVREQWPRRSGKGRASDF